MAARSCPLTDWQEKIDCKVTSGPLKSLTIIARTGNQNRAFLRTLETGVADDQTPFIVYDCENFIKNKGVLVGF